MTSMGEKSSAQEVGKAGAGHRELVRSLLTLPGGEIINRILDQQHPEKMVRTLSNVDLYWLMKKIGEADALPLLKLASQEQWQFLLDLEIWDRDRLEPEFAALWLSKLFQADPERFAKWFFNEGELFAYFPESFHEHGKGDDRTKDDGVHEYSPSDNQIDHFTSPRLLNSEIHHIIIKSARKVKQDEQIQSQ